MRHMSVLFLILIGFLTLLSNIRAGDAVKFPAVGSVLPGSFQPFNINGKKGKDRYHCLVCEFALNPVVMVFAKEGPDGDDPELGNLLAKLDEAIERHKDLLLHSFVVVLSQSAKSSVTEPKTDETATLLKEAESREKLTQRLSEVAGKLKHVVVSYYPEAGPKGYNLPAEPGVFVAVYYKHRVEVHHPFAHGKMQQAGIDQVIKSVDNMARKIHKKPAPPK